MRIVPTYDNQFSMGFPHRALWVDEGVAENVSHNLHCSLSTTDRVLHCGLLTNSSNINRS